MKATRSERAQRRAARLRNQRIAILAVLVIILAGAAYLAYTAFSGKNASSDMITTPSGLKYQDEVVGAGAVAQPGSNVTVDYTGWLADGTKFDSSKDSGQPFPFTIGAGQVIRGWDEGVAGMKVGGKRKLVIPPDLAYGATGNPPVIPANATLTFEVELLSVK